jgi:hypothetical protein
MTITYLKSGIERIYQMVCIVRQLLVCCMILVRIIYKPLSQIKKKSWHLNFFFNLYKIYFKVIQKFRIPLIGTSYFHFAHFV